MSSNLIKLFISMFYCGFSHSKRTEVNLKLVALLWLQPVESFFYSTDFKKVVLSSLWLQKSDKIWKK